MFKYSYPKSSTIKSFAIKFYNFTLLDHGYCQLKVILLSYEKLTATTLIYTNGARIRITVAAGTKFYLSNIIYNTVPWQIYLVNGTLAMSQTFGEGWFGGGL